MNTNLRVDFQPFFTEAQFLLGIEFLYTIFFQFEHYFLIYKLFMQKYGSNINCSYIFTFYINKLFEKNKSNIIIATKSN